MLLALNFFVMQWTCYRVGRCFLLRDGTNLGWCLVGPYWPLTGFPGLPEMKPIPSGGMVDVFHRIDLEQHRPGVDWKVRTR